MTVCFVILLSQRFTYFGELKMADEVGRLRNGIKAMVLQSWFHANVIKENINSLIKRKRRTRWCGKPQRRDATYKPDMALSILEIDNFFFLVILKV